MPQFMSYIDPWATFRGVPIGHYFWTASKYLGTAGHISETAGIFSVTAGFSDTASNFRDCRLISGSVYGLQFFRLPVTFQILPAFFR